MRWRPELSRSRRHLPRTNTTTETWRSTSSPSLSASTSGTEPIENIWKKGEAQRNFELLKMDVWESMLIHTNPSGPAAFQGSKHQCSNGAKHPFSVARTRRNNGAFATIVNMFFRDHLSSHEILISQVCPHAGAHYVLSCWQPPPHPAFASGAAAVMSMQSEEASRLQSQMIGAARNFTCGSLYLTRTTQSPPPPHCLMWLLVSVQIDGMPPFNYCSRCWVWKLFKTFAHPWKVE